MSTPGTPNPYLKSQPSSSPMTVTNSNSNTNTNIQNPAQTQGQAQPPESEVSRQDQIAYRFYIKTLGVLVEGRLKEKDGAKIDRWFNLPLPDGTEPFRQELYPYKTLSSTYTLPLNQPQTNTPLQNQNPGYGLGVGAIPSPSASALKLASLGKLDGVPPLLIAFTLDFSDLLINGQVEDQQKNRLGLVWTNSEKEEIELDLNALSSLDSSLDGVGGSIELNTSKGKGKEKAVDETVGAGSTPPITAIILERYTLLATSPLSPPPPTTTIASDTTSPKEARSISSATTSSISSSVSVDVGTSSSSSFVRPSTTAMGFTGVAGADFEEGMVSRKGKGRSTTQQHQEFIEGTRTPPTPYTPPSSAQAYKNGVAHFKSLHSFVKALPGYGLSQQIKSFERMFGGGYTQGGLKIGLKIWAAEGYGGERDRSNKKQSPRRKGEKRERKRSGDFGKEDDDSPFGSGSMEDLGSSAEQQQQQQQQDYSLAAAWEKMEQGTIPLSEDLAQFRLGTETLEEVERSARRPREKNLIKEFSDVLISNGSFRLKVEVRPSVHFRVVEAGRSTGGAQSTGVRLDDLDEEYFTPTLAKRKLEEGLGARPSSLPNEGFGGLGGIPRRFGGVAGGLSATRPVDLEGRRLSDLPGLPKAATTSFTGSGIGEGSGSGEGSVGSLSKWSKVGGGLPFAVEQSDRFRTTSLTERSSPIPMGSSLSRQTSRNTCRPSFGEFQPGMSPSSPGLRGAQPPFATSPRPSFESRAQGSAGSLGRNSFLSQSGRSFTQLNEARARLSTPPTGTSLGSQRSLTSPTAQGFLRTSSTGNITSISQLPRPPLAAQASSPAPLPSTAEERDNESEAQHYYDPSRLGVSSGSPAAPQMIKRYSGSFGQRHIRTTSGGGASSGGSSLGDGSLLGRSGLRRLSSRGSSDQPGLGGGRIFGQSTRLGSSVSPSDGDDINMFLKTLDALPRPPSLAVSGSRSNLHLPSTSSLLSTPQTPDSPSGRFAESSGTNTPAGASSISSSALMKRPLTKAQVDETLRRMAGSYTVAGPPFPLPGSSSQASSNNTTPQVGSLPIPTSSGHSSPLARRPSITPGGRTTSNLSRGSPPTSSSATAIPQSLNSRSVSSGGQNLASLASRVSGGSSVKSSSPLAGAPISAAPPSAPASPAFLPKKEGSTPLPAPLPIAVHSLPTDTGETSSEYTLRHLSKTIEAGLDTSSDGGGGTVVGSRPSSTDRERKRAPVLLRGGFGNWDCPPTTSGSSGNGGNGSPVIGGQRALSPASSSASSALNRSPVTGPIHGRNLSTLGRDIEAELPSRREFGRLERGYNTNPGSVTVSPVRSPRGTSEGPMSDGGGGGNGISGWTAPRSASSRAIVSTTNSPAFGRSPLPGISSGLAGTTGNVNSHGTTQQSFDFRDREASQALIQGLGMASPSTPGRSRKQSFDPWEADSGGFGPTGERLHQGVGSSTTKLGGGGGTINEEEEGKRLTHSRALSRERRAGRVVVSSEEGSGNSPTDTVDELIMGRQGGGNDDNDRRRSWQSDEAEGDDAIVGDMEMSRG